VKQQPKFPREVVAKFFVEAALRQPDDPSPVPHHDTQFEAAVVRFIMGVGKPRSV
jgi:hypothetical protein